MNEKLELGKRAAHRAPAKSDVDEGLRNRAISTVQEAFEADLIDVEELERRLDLAKTTQSKFELEGLIASSTPVPSEIPNPPNALEPIPKTGVAVAVFGASKRAGRWTMPSTFTAAAAFGSVELDLRETALGPVSDLRAFATLGSVEIILPPEVRVELNGTGILGGFDQSGGSTPALGPLVRVTGLAILGSVHVSIRDPGGSTLGAWWKKTKRALSGR